MIRMRSLWPVGVLAGAAAWVGVNLATKTPQAAAAGPIAQIIAPPPGFKLRQGRTASVRVRVQPGDRPLQGWTLRLRSPDGSE